MMCAGGVEAAPVTSAYAFTVRQYGEDVSLSQFKDCVTVVVNVASELGVRSLMHIYTAVMTRLYV